MWPSSKEDIISLLHAILREKKQANEENHVSIAETIIRMQKSRRDSPTFVDLVSKTSSVIEKLMIKLSRNKFKVGDIVYMKESLADLNWRMSPMLDKAFIVVETPKQTDKYNQYIIKQLEHPDFTEYSIGQDFIYSVEEYRNEEARTTIQNR